MVPPQEPGAGVSLLSGVGGLASGLGGSSPIAPRAPPAPLPKMTSTVSRLYGPELLGQSVSVYQPRAKAWTICTVREYNESSGQHTLVAADGKTSSLALAPGVRFKWTAGSPPRAAFNITYSPANSPSGRSAIGRRLRVFWPRMGRYYQGTVSAYSASDNKHRVDYPNDGDWHWVDLRYESVQWLDSGASSDGSPKAVDALAHSNSSPQAHARTSADMPASKVGQLGTSCNDGACWIECDVQQSVMEQTISVPLASGCPAEL
eukprot:306366-Chlamydomonas_euryale.AAC.5